MVYSLITSPLNTRTEYANILIVIFVIYVIINLKKIVFDTSNRLIGQNELLITDWQFCSQLKMFKIFYFVTCIKNTQLLIKNYVPSEHITPASSEWPQLCLPMGDFLQSKRFLSVPPHKTSSIQIWPVPRPKNADNFGMAFSLLKVDKQHFGYFVSCKRAPYCKRTILTVYYIWRNS